MGEKRDDYKIDRKYRIEILIGIIFLLVLIFSDVLKGLKSQSPMVYILSSETEDFYLVNGILSFGKEDQLDCGKIILKDDEDKSDYKIIFYYLDEDEERIILTTNYYNEERHNNGTKEKELALISGKGIIDKKIKEDINLLESKVKIKREDGEILEQTIPLEIKSVDTKKD